jgi:hypothetical protein
MQRQAPGFVCSSRTVEGDLGMKRLGKEVRLRRRKDVEAAVNALADNWRFGMETLLLRVGEP